MTPDRAQARTNPSQLGQPVAKTRREGMVPAAPPDPVHPQDRAVPPVSSWGAPWLDTAPRGRLPRLQEDLRSAGTCPLPPRRSPTGQTDGHVLLVNIWIYSRPLQPLCGLAGSQLSALHGY